MFGSVRVRDDCVFIGAQHQVRDQRVCAARDHDGYLVDTGSQLVLARHRLLYELFHCLLYYASGGNWRQLDQHPSEVRFVPKTLSFTP